MSRVACLLYGLLAYLIFLAAFLYAIGFIANAAVPKGIDGGDAGPLSIAITVDLALLALFAIQHDVMARRWFKAWWTRYVPQPIERSTYVAASSLLLILLYWQWRPIPATVWRVENPLGRDVIWAVYFIGWAMVFCSSFLIDHFELFGLKQVWMHFEGRETPQTPFTERSFYRWVRHPLMLGFIIAFWSGPTMSYGRLLFAVVTTVWILIAIQLEERDLINVLGEPYRRYRERTPMLLPSIWSRRK